MTENFSLLTIVSNNIGQNVPDWAKIAIQVSMWVAVAAQFFLLVPDMIHVLKTKDTRENKWYKWIVWFICSSAWICYSIFLLWENIPLQEVIGLAVAEAINLICLFVIYGIKIINIVRAKKFGLTEKQWCWLMNAFYVAKKSLSKPILHKLKDLCKDMTVKERAELYIDALKIHKFGRKVKKSIKKTAKHIAKDIIKIIEEEKEED